LPAGLSAAFAGEKALLAFRIPLVLDPGLYIGYYYRVKFGDFRYNKRSQVQGSTFRVREKDEIEDPKSS